MSARYFVDGKILFYAQIVNRELNTSAPSDGQVYGSVRIGALLKGYRHRR